MGEKIEKQKYDPLVLAIISGTIRLMVLLGKSIEAFVQLGERNTKISKRGIEGKKKNISSKIERNFATIEEFEIHANFKNLEFSRILKIGRTINSPEWMIWFYL